MLTSVHEVVTALGGTGKVAELLEVTGAAVSKAKAKGWLPATWHIRIKEMTARRRLKVAPELFTLPSRRNPDGRLYRHGRGVKRLRP